MSLIKKTDEYSIVSESAPSIASGTIYLVLNLCKLGIKNNIPKL